MNMRAQSFASAAHELAEKYQKKKWWQIWLALTLNFNFNIAITRYLHYALRELF